MSYRNEDIPVDIQKKIQALKAELAQLEQPDQSPDIALTIAKEISGDPITEAPIIEAPAVEQIPDLTAAENEAREIVYGAALAEPETIQEPAVQFVEDTEQSQREREERWSQSQKMEQTGQICERCNELKDANGDCSCTVIAEPEEEDSEPGPNEAEADREAEEDQRNAIKDPEAVDIAENALPKVDKDELEEIEEDSKRESARFLAKQTVPIFTVRNGDLEQFKRLIKTCRTLVEELTISITGDSISSRQMDSSHVALFDMNLSSQDFQKYSCLKPGNLSIRLDDFTKMLESGKKKDDLELSAESGESLFVKLKGSRNKEYELCLIHSTQSVTPLPKLTYDSSFEMEPSEFEDILKENGKVSSYLTISSNREGVTFSGKGDTGKYKTTATTEDRILQSLYCEKESAANYSMEYIEKFVKALKPEKIKFEFSSKMPLKITSPIGRNSFISFYLAPRVQE